MLSRIRRDLRCIPTATILWLMQKQRQTFDQGIRSRDSGPTPGFRCCDAEGCTSEGTHRAPKARDRLSEHYWFCLTHVRLYNQAWDYCQGLSQTEIEAMIRRDTIWQRPTWPLGSWERRERDLRARIWREFAGDDDATRAPGGGASAHRTEPETPRERAMRVLDLEAPVSFAQVKARYRALVKIYHPDANGGDKISEERLKSINEAYTTLKSCFGLT